MQYSKQFILCVLCASAVHSAFGADPNTKSKVATAAPKFTLLMTGGAGGGGMKAPVPVSLISISAAMPESAAVVVYLDPAGAQKSVALKDIIALAPASWVPTAETSGPERDAETSDLPVPRLDLADSQRFVGTLVNPAAGGKALVGGVGTDAPVVIRHDKLGVLSFPLDRVSRYFSIGGRMPDLGGRVLSQTADTVLLTNTDRLEGLVTRLGPTVWIETKGSGSADPKAPKGAPPAASAAATQIDVETVRFVQLVNPPTRLKSLRVDLADGTVVAVDSLSAETRLGKMLIHPIDAPVARNSSAETPSVISLDIGQLSAVVPDPSRLTPLSSLTIAAQAPAPGRTAINKAKIMPDTTAPLSAADILLPAPMSVEWALPPGAASVIGYAQMDDQSFAWGDCTAVVSVVPASGPERELARGHLNADNPTLTIAADLGAVGRGDRLKVRTESGEKGPIQDRVVLRRMVLLSK
jgi:hypothetical protein